MSSVVATMSISLDGIGTGHHQTAGGPTTTNEYLAAGLVDELALQVSPSVLGDGLRLFDGVGPLRLQQISGRSTSLVTHVRYRVLPAADEAAPAS